MSYSFRPHGLQHPRPPCLSLSPKVFSNSCPLSQWCHATTSSSATLFSFCLQSFLALGSFPMSRLFISDGQSSGASASASASVLPMSIQGWFPLRLTGLSSLQSNGLSRFFSRTTTRKHWFFFVVKLLHPYMTPGKTIALTVQTFVGKMTSLLFNILS